MNRNDEHYEDFLAELRLAGLVVDPVPERVTFAAKASLAWRTVDAELAELTYDSALDADRLTLVRGAAAARLLTFSASGLTADIQGAETDGGRARARPRCARVAGPRRLPVPPAPRGRFRGGARARARGGGGALEPLGDARVCRRQPRRAPRGRRRRSTRHRPRCGAAGNAAG